MNSRPVACHDRHTVGRDAGDNADALPAASIASRRIVDRFGGTYLVRGGRTLQIEGAEPSGRVVVIAFPSLSAAQAFESAPESLAAAAIRHRTATSRIYVVEGASP